MAALIAENFLNINILEYLLRKKEQIGFKIVAKKFRH